MRAKAAVPARTRSKLELGGQLAATALVLAFVPSNGIKLLTLAVLWALTFGKIPYRQMVLYVGACAFFTAMNIAALNHGVFFFRHPDFLGMPVYEFFMWGFYVLHLIRMVGGPGPERDLRLALPLAIALALPFALVTNPYLLLLTTAAVLAVAFAFFHERWDFAYAGYMVVVGALIEYTGVWSGQWGYPGNPPGGVPLWFITLWGGVGLFTRRLVLPLLRPPQQAAA